MKSLADLTCGPKRYHSRIVRTSLEACALAGAIAIGTASAASSGAAPAPQVNPPGNVGNRVAVGSRNVSRYQAMYGSPEFRGLDDEESRPWPTKQAIRTVGRLEEIPGRGRRADPSLATTPAGREWDNAWARYEICAERLCLAIVPVEELQDTLPVAASSWVHRNVEVIGAIDQLQLPGIDPRTAPVAFQIWSVFEAPDTPARKQGSKGSSLEPLVRYPQGAEGRVVTVSGVFRGANLFEDLPPESRRADSDWVLRDGPFSIWVTGRAPRGKGFSLDPRSRADCRFRIEATGKVSTANGYVYLRATGLQLLGRATDE